MRQVVALLVLAIAGCEQVLGVDAYVEEPTSASTASGQGGNGGAGGGTSAATTSSTTTASSSSTGVTNACYNEDDAVYITEAHQIVGHQNLCTTEQLAQLEGCWLNNNLACYTAFIEDPDNAECKGCIQASTASSRTIPVLLTSFGVEYYYVQVLACEAVVEGKEHCIEAVALEFCRVTACEDCYDDDDAYNDCLEYALEDGCPGVTLPPDCESIYTTYSKECWSTLLEERLVKTANILCGP